MIDKNAATEAWNQECRKASEYYAEKRASHNYGPQAEEIVPQREPDIPNAIAQLACARNEVRDAIEKLRSRLSPASRDFLNKACRESDRPQPIRCAVALSIDEVSESLLLAAEDLRTMYDALEL